MRVSPACSASADAGACRNGAAGGGVGAAAAAAAAAQGW
jgi:hypothetical protein